MQIVNLETGARLTMSNNKMRLSRLRRRIKAWSVEMEYLEENYKRPIRKVMITLEYKPGVDYSPNDIRDYMSALKKYCEKGLLAYAWVAELHKSGKIHYHVYLYVIRGTDIPMPDKSGMWDKGFSGIETGRSPYYLVTYVGKEYQKKGDYPKGIRIFAVWIKKEILPKIRLWKFRLSAFPQWLREEMLSQWYYVGLYPARVEGGGWEVDLSMFDVRKNIKLVSPWVVLTNA